LTAEIFKCTPTPPKPSPKPAPLTTTATGKVLPEICEMYGATECALHSTNCSLCKNALAGTELCFDNTIAAKLPPRKYSAQSGPAKQILSADFFFANSTDVELSALFCCNAGPRYPILCD
jgi:hypothetical protein